MSAGVHSHRRRAPRLAAAVVTALLGIGTGHAVAATPIGFAPPVFVDDQLAGGEPLVLTDNVHHTLIYTAHEGTTHLYRDGITFPADFVANYRNQVNIWVSKDNGATWQRDDFSGTGFATNPAQNQGFSDPDLTQDEGGRVYNTGIDLANDALFSTNDGGYTWDRGTAQCHDGDRPWLAGGKKDEVFMGTNTLEGAISHEVFQSTDGGSTCAADGIPNGGTTDDGWSYSGNGKLYYDHHNGKLIEPVTFTKGNDTAQGAATWTRGQDAFDKPVMAAKTTTFAHWPAMAIDASDNVYLVWDTDPRQPGTTGGCGGARTELPNAIQMSVSKDFGKTWSKPVDIAKPGNGKVYWPWIVAGDEGKVSIVWYQADTVVDLDCTPAKTSIYEATILDATSSTPHPQIVDAVGRPVHTNFVCQGGTTCVATGQDRRLGDFFTNEIDPNGCVLIASGDTTRPAPGGGERPTALPIFLRQNAGPGLRGKSCGGPSESCNDRAAPSSTIKLGPARRERIDLSGRSSDRGAPCASGVRTVQVSLARVTGQGGHECRFLRSRTKYLLTEPRSCRRPVLFKAKGTSRWHFTFSVRLPSGKYRAQARGTDRKGNKETPRSGRVAFRMR